jgi:cationic peptide transport system substrate-binding protein
MKRISRALGYTLLLCCTLSGCKRPPNNDEFAGIVYCAEGSPETFNPQLDTSGTTMDAISQHLYDRLIDINATNGGYLPALAKSWQVSADGLVYSFELRDDVEFHHTDYFTPTRRLQAEDVKFTFERILNPQHPYHSQGKGYPYFDSIGWQANIAAIHVSGPHRIEFRLLNPDSAFLSSLATDFAAILSAEYAASLLTAQTPTLLDSKPIGTGPFKFRAYQKDMLIRYNKHPDYWRHPVMLEQLVIDITPNNTKRLAKLLTHECDVVSMPQLNELPLLKSRPDLAVDAQTSMNVSFWAFNTEKAPFNNALVRQALSHAVNRDDIIRAVYSNEADLAGSLLPPNSWAFYQDHAMPSFDAKKAKQLLREAGYPNGFRMDIWAMPVQRAYNPNAQKMAELIQANLSAIGVRARIVTYEWNTFRQKLRQQEHDSVLIGWSADTADPDNFLRPLLSCEAARSGSNRANWCDEEFDALLSLASLEADPAKRRHYYLQSQQRIVQQMPLLPIAHSKRFLVRNKLVNGVHVNPFGGISFAEARKSH